MELRPASSTCGRKGHRDPQRPTAKPGLQYPGLCRFQTPDKTQKGYAGPRDSGEEKGKGDKARLPAGEGPGRAARSARARSSSPAPRAPPVSLSPSRPRRLSQKSRDAPAARERPRPAPRACALELAAPGAQPAAPSRSPGEGSGREGPGHGAGSGTAGHRPHRGGWRGECPVVAKAVAYTAPARGTRTELCALVSEHPGKREVSPSGLHSFLGRPCSSVTCCVRSQSQLLAPSPQLTLSDACADLPCPELGAEPCPWR